ncbi:hypothetical protein [Rhodococcus sp. IEGM 1379]|uniref:hypothetical protein n=1 Tax=Rhodococcus sp. IEGM 1379 TaxID=3047086 RepID=UPI0024B86770|nr:hypothetical protein [Rhodococcus sp. IEGM 1379]MDI9917204.1 hypothetical protein [Rhodococcus sp. IEGM 1379]
MSTSPSAVAQRKSIGLTAISALATFTLVGGIVAGFAGPATSVPARCDETKGDRTGFAPDDDRHDEPSFPPVGPTVPVSGNSRLDDDQELIISYLLQNPHPFTTDTLNGVADDSTSGN